MKKYLQNKALLINEIAGFNITAGFDIIDQQARFACLRCVSAEYPGRCLGILKKRSIAFLIPY